MANRSYGFDVLIERATEEVVSEISSQREDAIGDSEIEKLFFVSLGTFLRLGMCEYEGMLVPKDDAMAVRLLDQERSRYCLVVEPQKTVDGWRVDFLIHAYDWAPHGGKEGWRRLIVECDGHNFHERTKEQAARDRARDREAQCQGLKVFRFTGAELWRDPWACAEQVVEWAQQGL